MNTQLSELAKRLVTLSDGRQGLRGTIQTEIREPSSAEPQHPESGIQKPASNTLEFTSSDETLDRYGEIITASGWKLANYQRNPVFQNAHQYGDIIHTLGRALTTEVRSSKLVQTIQFATDVNPLARIAYGLYKGKFLNAVSVGFVPIRWQNGGQEAGYVRKHLEQELLEVSAVSIPANPNALALAYKSGALEKGDVRELSQLLNSLTRKDELPRVPDQVRQPSTTNTGDLLLLAREVHALLKHI